MHIGEALGFSSTIQWVHELRLGLLDFELDFKKIVDSCVTNRCDSAKFRAIINNCNYLVSYIKT